MTEEKPTRHRASHKDSTLIEGRFASIEQQMARDRKHVDQRFDTMQTIFEKFQSTVDRLAVRVEDRLHEVDRDGKTDWEMVAFAVTVGFRVIIVLGTLFAVILTLVIYPTYEADAKTATALQRLDDRYHSEFKSIHDEMSRHNHLEGHATSMERHNAAMHRIERLEADQKEAERCPNGHSRE